MKIGYQGEIGSNSEAAAIEFIKHKGWNEEECELIPLVESRHVIGQLKDNKIDFGVVAVKNSVAGIVLETKEALKDGFFVEVDTIVLPIHHCLFIKDGADINAIKYVTSHIQALNQTKVNRSKLFPSWEGVETNDTASAARELSEGIFPDDYAVICRKNAGEKYGLKLVKENIEDNPDNHTEFKVMINK